jgi:hypothetical protein
LLLEHAIVRLFEGVQRGTLAARLAILSAQPGSNSGWHAEGPGRGANPTWGGGQPGDWQASGGFADPRLRGRFISDRIARA